MTIAKKSSEDIELELRKIGKDYCEKYSEQITGRHISAAYFESLLNTKTRPICSRCIKTRRYRRNCAITISIILIIFILIVAN